MGSVIPQVKDAIETLLAANGDLSDVLIARGPPRDNKDEQILIFDAKAPRNIAALGRTNVPLDESFAIKVLIEVLMADGSEDYESAEDRSWTLTGYVEDSLRADPKLGLGQTNTYGLDTEVEQQFFRTDTKRGSRVILTVSGSARI